MVTTGTEFEPVTEGLRHFGEEWNHPPAVPFAVSYSEHGLVEVNIVQREIQQLLTPEAGVDQKRENCAVTDSAGNKPRLLSGRDQASDFAWCEEHGGGRGTLGEHDAPEGVVRDAMPVAQVGPEGAQSVEASANGGHTKPATLEPDEIAPQVLGGHGLRCGGSAPPVEESEIGADVVVVSGDGLVAEPTFSTQVCQELGGQGLEIHGSALLGRLDCAPRVPSDQGHLRASVLLAGSSQRQEAQEGGI